MDAFILESKKNSLCLVPLIDGGLNLEYCSGTDYPANILQITDLNEMSILQRMINNAIEYISKHKPKLPKEVYEKRKEYVEKVMSNNKKIDILTEEQHDALAELCKRRHRLHSSLITIKNVQRFYNHLTKINNQLKESGMSLIMEFVPEEINNLGPEIKQQLKENQFKHLLKLHDKIEKYLKKIDKAYGTNYCPTGYLREKKEKNMESFTASNADIKFFIKPLQRGGIFMDFDHLSNTELGSSSMYVTDLDKLLLLQSIVDEAIENFKQG